MKTRTEIKRTLHGLMSCLLTVQVLLAGTAKAEVSAETVSNFAALPIISSQTAPPLVMLTMAKDHKLYYEAYNDASDLDGDGTIDIGYKPDAIDYYGYFDSYKCYEYDSTDARFEPQNTTNNKKCSGSDEWSGDFLNYLTMSRMDALRKVFYGGLRLVDSATETELERSYIPQDAHSWGKEYKDIARDGYDIREYSPLNLPTGHKYHLFANTTIAGGQPLLRVLEDKNNRIWEWLSKERPVADNSLGTPTDYSVHVLVCVSSLLEKNCKRYPSGAYKPTGLLHTYGESNSMYFGLITGTYAKNTSGGVLRKKVGSISNEINTNTGQFLTGVNGIISTMNRLKIVEFRSGDHSYEPGWSGAWIATRPINEGEQPNWGNPIAEMMYEGVRYFAGKAAPTPDFSIATTGNQDASLGLPLDSWDDPYDTNTGYPECSSPYQIVVSDINPSYDTDQVPGSYFNNAFSGDVTGLNVETLADTISTNEPSSTGTHFIGHSATNYDGAPSAKNVTSLGNIRGLSPEEPTKLGGYYSASVSYFARNNDLNPATGGQKMNTFAVALASPLPSIEIPVNGNTITLVPFAKSVGGCLGISGAQGDFQPTNQIVDFYAETVTPTSGKFRINYEDVEQGADHDMDAIVEYAYDVDTTAGTVDITLDSTYAAGCVIQHMGYVISGTTQDGVYLEVRDADTGTDPDYFLDTPPGQGPGGTWNDGSALPLTTTRTFTPSGSSAATLLKDPLWYAAKWGGFVDKNNNDIPDLQTEWDNKNSFGLSLPDGNPDNYYLVANPLELERSLARVFDDITARTSSGTAAAVVANSRQGLGAVYQAIYEPLRRDASSREVNWIGTLHSLFLDEYGYLREDGDGDARLDGYTTDPVVELFYDDLSNTSKVRRYSSSDATTFTPSSNTTDSLKSLKTIWNAREQLSALSSVSSQRTYSSSASTGRYIFTWMDTDEDEIVDSTEVEDFDKSQISSSNYGWLNVADETTAEKLVDYMRGVEISGFRTRTIDYDDDGSTEVIRLGDIIHSTPTVVDTPAEAFDLLYGDTSYGVFRKKYENRRRVVYVGANDGMLHAFNGGFYDVKNRQFSLQSPGGGTETSHPLGSELWAYVPMNLLPHLNWYAAVDYPHVYYMDAKPRVFDAKIFDVGSGGVTGQSGGATTHPGGWGTVLVAGMRLGGGEITVDTAADGLGASNSDSNTDDDRTLSSAYVILDITDPEQPPALIAELRTPNLGFTTVYPTAFALRETDDSPNGWYLVFGTGPNDLVTVTSDHAAELYVYDLYNQQFVSGFGPGDVTLEANSFLGDPVSVDWGLSYRADAVYFGTVNGTPASPGGKLYRLKINPDNTTAKDNPTNWVGPDVLLNLSKPVVATPTVSVDKQDQHWIFVGTGRFFSNADKSSTAAQALYAVKDPGSGSVALSDLLNVTNATVFEDGTLEGTVSGLTTPSTFHDLMDYIASSKKGWILDLPSGTDPSARVVNQSALLGQVLLTTAYTPNTDICRAEGRSALYGLHFQTGTSLPNTNTFGIGTATCSSCQTTQHELVRSVDIGVGLASSPSLHTIPGNSNSSSGSVSSGDSQSVKVFTQTSTGAIVAESAKVGGSLRSGEVSWRELE